MHPPLRDRLLLRPTIYKEDSRLHMASWTVVLARTASIDASGGRYCCGAQTRLKTDIHHTNAIAGLDPGDVDARGKGTPLQVREWKFLFRVKEPGKNALLPVTVSNHIV